MMFEMGNPNANLCGKPSAGFSKMRNSLPGLKVDTSLLWVQQIKWHGMPPSKATTVVKRAESENTFLASFLCTAEDNCYA